MPTPVDSRRRRLVKHCALNCATEMHGIRGILALDFLSRVLLSDVVICICARITAFALIPCLLTEPVIQKNITTSTKCF